MITVDPIDTIETNFSIRTIVDERKYKIMLHNQTVRINRDLRSTCITALALKNTELAEIMEETN